MLFLLPVFAVVRNPLLDDSILFFSSRFNPPPSAPDHDLRSDTVLGTTVPVCDAPTLLHFPAFYELPNGVANVSFAYKCSETIKIGPFSSVNIARIAAAGTGEFCRVSAD